MSENQKILIDSYTDFTKLLSEFELCGIVNNYIINLSHKDFITALKNKTDFEFTYCKINIEEENGKNDRYDFQCKLTFRHCTFDDGLSLKYLHLHNNIEFNNCNFEFLQVCFVSANNNSSSFIITKSEVKRSIELKGVSDIDINITSNCKRIIRRNVSSPLKIYNSEDFSFEYDNYIFENYEFNHSRVKSIDFNNCKFNSEFIVDSFIEDSIKEIKICSCSFENTVNFKERSLESISISKSTFYDKLLITSTSISYLNLINCSFENRVDICNLNEFIYNINLEDSTIKGRFSLKGANEGIRLKHPSSIISFNNIFIENTGYLIIRKIKNGNFNFNYANVLGQLVMQELDIDSLQMHNASIIGSLIAQDIKLKELDLKNTSLIGKLVFNPSDTLNIFDSNIIKNRETAYLLKKGKQEEGDSISASHFKRKELQLYLKDCTSDFNLSKLKECIVLFFNKISNDFGQSWVRGIIFTMSFAYMFYLLINFYGLEKPIFRFAWSLEGFGTAWKEYLKILNVLNFNDKLDNFKFTPLGETLFFVSKIFVSYGIYQTVSAFRKFGK